MVGNILQHKHTLLSQHYRDSAKETLRKDFLCVMADSSTDKSQLTEGFQVQQVEDQTSQVRRELVEHSHCGVDVDLEASGDGYRLFVPTQAESTLTISTRQIELDYHTRIDATICWRSALKLFFLKKN